MKYITDWNKTDAETSIILQKNEKYYNIDIESVENILHYVRNPACSSTISSYPSETEEVLKNEDPKRKCRVYRNYNDGGGCVYENVYCIELL